MNTLQTLTGLPTNHPSYAHDFSRRFHGGYLLYKDDLIYIGGNISNYKYECYNISKQESFVLDITNTEEAFDIWIPEMGYYAKKEGYIFIKQVPARQWCRTFNPGQSYRVTEFPPQRGGSKNHFLSILNNKVHNHKQYNSDYGYVLSKKLLIINGYLYYLQTLIGTVDSKNKVITLNEPIIQQEIYDTLQRIGEYGWTLIPTLKS